MNRAIKRRDFPWLPSRPAPATVTFGSKPTVDRKRPGRVAGRTHTLLALLISLPPTGQGKRQVERVKTRSFSFPLGWLTSSSSLSQTTQQCLSA